MARPADSEVRPDTLVEDPGVGAIVSRYLTDPVEAREVFKLFRNQRSQLCLRFDSAPDAFSGLVLDVEPDNVLLEDIRPRSGLSLLQAGRPFNLTGRSEGVFAYAEEMRCAEALSERGVPYFRVPLPARMLYQQRRRAARFRIPLRVATHGAEVVLSRADGKAVPGAIVDISVGGCRAAFEGFPFPALEVEEQIPHCRVNIPKLLDLSAVGSIRHVNYDQALNSTTCGIEFVEMDVTARRRLEQFVQSLARTAKV